MSNPFPTPLEAKIISFVFLCLLLGITGAIWTVRRNGPYASPWRVPPMPRTPDIDLEAARPWPSSSGPFILNKPFAGAVLVLEDDGRNARWRKCLQRSEGSFRCWQYQWQDGTAAMSLRAPSEAMVQSGVVTIIPGEFIPDHPVP